MGTTSTTEFCHRRNHTWADVIGGDDESMWELLVDQYEVLRSAESGGLQGGRYLDVLNKLDRLLDFRVK